MKAKGKKNLQACKFDIVSLEACFANMLYAQDMLIQGERVESWHSLSVVVQQTYISKVEHHFAEWKLRMQKLSKFACILVFGWFCCNDAFCGFYVAQNSDYNLIGAAGGKQGYEANAKANLAVTQAPLGFSLRLTDSYITLEYIQMNIQGEKPSRLV